MKVLLTAFEPFEGREENQSLSVAKQLVDMDASIELVLLPVTFDGCFAPIEKRLNEIAKNSLLIVSLGEAASIQDLQMEQVALNKMHAPLRGDNLDSCPVDETIESEAPLAVESGFSPKKVLELFESQNSKIKISYSAGQYVCNRLYWSVLRYQKDRNYRGIFFHVPVSMDETLKRDICQRLMAFIRAVQQEEL